VGDRLNFDDLTNAAMLQTTIAVATPLLLAALGEMIIERSGVLNLSIEGMMTLGASVAFCVAYGLGGVDPGAVLGGLGAAALSCVVVALVLGAMVVTLPGNQATVGITLLIVCTGLAALIYRLSVGTGVETPRIETLHRVRLGPLADLPLVGRALFAQNLYVYAALLTIVPVTLLLFHTPAGARVRACGENPRSIESLGVSVARVRYLALAAGAALIGLAGGFFPLTLTGTYSDNTVGGRGWLALMLVIFGRWRPGSILAGALLFAYADAVQFRFAASSSTITPQFLQMIPYALALITIVLVSRRSGSPAALGSTYQREARVSP
jgi:ABC-type uncharacterized transport system permease subunit